MRISRRMRLGASAAALALIAVTSVGSTLGHSSEGRGSDSGHGQNGALKHVFVIMLENHSYSTVIGNKNAPFINSLADTYGLATNYYGVTHPSLPNYVAAISGSNWFVNDDQPTHRFDHTNLVDQLEASHHSWAAYMESMPSAGYLGDQAPGTNELYVSKHNPFILFDDIRNNPARRAKIKPYSDFASDLKHNRVADFVWITPNQCNDMHGGIYVQLGANDGTPCPYGSAKDDANDASLKQKADAFVKTAVTQIMASKAWTGNSAIFVLTDENDFNGANTDNGQWDSAAGCCDSPILPDGYQFLDKHGNPATYTDSAGVVHPLILDCPGDATECTYGGGQIPAIVIARHGARHYTSDTPYNHYSLLRTIEENWNLPYLGNASDNAQVTSMKEFFAH